MSVGLSQFPKRARSYTSMLPSEHFFLLQAKVRGLGTGTHFTAVLFLTEFAFLSASFFRRFSLAFRRNSWQNREYRMKFGLEFYTSFTLIIGLNTRLFLGFLLFDDTN